MNAPASSAIAVRKIERAVSYAMPRTLIAGTLKPWVLPSPRARYRSWIDAGRTPTAWPISQIIQRACCFSSSSPNTAARTRLSIVGERSAPSPETARRPSRTVTSAPNRAFRAWILSMVVVEGAGMPEPAAPSATSPLNRVPAVGFRKQVPFLPGLLGVRPSEHRVGELLSKLHARLIERIYPIHLAGVDRGDLEEHEQRAQMPGVGPVDVNRHVDPAAPRERASRRPLLDRQQLAELMSAQVAKFLDVAVQLGDLDSYAPLIDGYERDGLVRRAFHEQLHLAVLVRRAKRGQRRRANPWIAFRAVLAQTLRPQLNEPVSQIAQRIGVRHQHVNVPAERRVG